MASSDKDKQPPKTPKKKAKARKSATKKEKTVQEEPQINPMESEMPTWRLWLRRSLAGFALILAVAVAGGYLYFTSSGVLGDLITSNFNQMSNGKLSLKVTQSSLFRGFVFEDIEILSGPDFDNKPLVKLKKFSLLYNLYGFWVGDFGIHEVGIYKPEIFLIQKNDIWNAQTLMKPGEKKEEEPEKEEEKPKEPSKPQESLDLPFSLRVFFKFVLEDFALTVDAPEKGNSNPMQVGVKNFTFRTHILTKEFSHIPLNASAIEIIDTFLVQMVPRQEIDIYFKSPLASTKTPFNLHWLLALDGKTENPRFTSRLKIGNKKIPVVYKGKHKLPLNFLIDYRLHYDPVADRLSLHHFAVHFANDTWLNLTGKITDVQKKDKMNIDMSLDRSTIRLKPLYSLLKKFQPKSRMKFGGSISLAPLVIEGGLNNLHVDGKVKMKGIRFRQPGLSVSLPFFNLYYETKVNLGKKSKIPWGVVEFAKAGWRGSFNGSRLKADIDFVPQKKVDVGIFVKNFRPAPFSGGFLRSGAFNLGLTVKGPSENHLTAIVKLGSPAFYYDLRPGKSGLNRLKVYIKTMIDAPTISALLKQKGLSVFVSNLDMYLKNKQGFNALKYRSSVNVRMHSKNAIDVKYNMKETTVNFVSLYPTLTAALKESMKSLKKTLKKGVSLNGKTKVKLRGKKIDVNHGTNVIVKDFDIDDIWLKAGVKVRPKKITIDAVTLTGLKEALNLKVWGNLTKGMQTVPDPKRPGRVTKKKGMVPDLHVTMKLGKEKREAIFQNHAISGFFGLNVRLLDNIAKGSLKIDHFNYDDSKLTKVKDINMNFPFEYNLAYQKSLNLTAANKERIIKNYSFTKPFNFTIESVQIAHPFPGKNPETEEPLPPKPFMLIYPQGKYKGFSARLEFKDNVFEMPSLQIFMLNGLITAQDILFNLGTFNPKTMELVAGMQIKDLDLKQLMDPEKAKAIKDGAISMDMFFTGRDFSQPLQNLKGYVSIYKIGDEFAKQGLKVVKPDSGGMVDFIVDNTISVSKFDLDLKEGLVYARIYMKKGFIGQATITPQGEQIVQERIPIGEFLNNASKQAAVYGSAKADSDKKKKQTTSTE